jgi:hypothetical protein
MSGNRVELTQRGRETLASLNASTS